MEKKKGKVKFWSKKGIGAIRENLFVTTILKIELQILKKIIVYSKIDFEHNTFFMFPKSLVLF